MNRKIELPSYCCPHTVKFRDGDLICDHDYPPEDKVEHDTYVEWKCSKCGGVMSVEIYD